MIYLILGWCAVGFFPALILCWLGTKGKEVRIRDLCGIVGLTLLGPIGCIGIVCQLWQDFEVGDKIVLDRTKK